MFVVLFEVHPRSDQWDAYLGYAKLLRPELARVDGFIDNVRYRSRRRAGLVLSLSTWRDEKALIRWRTHAVHHEVQGRGRGDVFRDYHLRVGEIAADSHWPGGGSPPAQRFDETEVGESKLVTLVEARRCETLPEPASAELVGARLGLAADAHGLVDWDVFESIPSPSDLLLLLSWRDLASAAAGEPEAAAPDEARRRQVRVVRDYGMFQRWEAPQYYPDPAGRSPESP